MNSSELCHGQILGITVTSPHFVKTLEFYEDVLGYEKVELRRINKFQANFWNANALKGNQCAILKPKLTKNYFVRIVEQAISPNFESGRHFGWAAFEISVKDVFALHNTMISKGFDVIGTPKKIPGFDYFIPMQMRAIGGEILYLNQVLQNMPNLDLPMSDDLAGKTFIAVVAAQDLEETTAWYVNNLAFQRGDSFNIVYGTINKNFVLPDDTTTKLEMVVNDRLPILEIDQYPKAASLQRNNNFLASGNAIVSFAVEANQFTNKMRSQTKKIQHLEYGEASAAFINGPNGEGIELIFV